MSYDKGNRNENRAVTILGQVVGSGSVEKVDSYSNHDPFGFVDLIGLRPDEKVLFVQVKTNSFTSSDRRKYQRKLHRLPDEFARFEVWVRVDRTGWKFYAYNAVAEEFHCYLEMETCDQDETVECLREEHPYWPPE